MPFSGSDYNAKWDRTRLTKQLKVIADLMWDQHWRTLRAISDLTGYGEASISAQLRNLRKVKFGGYTVLKQTVGDRKNGLFEYRLNLDATPLLDHPVPEQLFLSELGHCFANVKP